MSSRYRSLSKAPERVSFAKPVVRITPLGRELLLSSSEQEIRRTGGRALSKSEKRIAATVKRQMWEGKL